MYEMHSLALPAVKVLVYSARFVTCAGVVELVDTTDSKSVAFKSVPVQVRPPVPLFEVQSPQTPERPLRPSLGLKFQEVVMHESHLTNHTASDRCPSRGPMVLYQAMLIARKKDTSRKMRELKRRWIIR